MRLHAFCHRDDSVFFGKTARPAVRCCPVFETRVAARLETITDARFEVATSFHPPWNIRVVFRGRAVL
jgi:hypothetical protein